MEALGQSYPCPPALEEAGPCESPAVVRAGRWRLGILGRLSVCSAVCPLHVGLVPAQQSGGTALEWDKPGLTSELGDYGQGSEPQSLGFLICEAGRRWPPLQVMGLFSLTKCMRQLKSSGRLLLSPTTMTRDESSRQWPPQSPAAGPWSQPARAGPP